MGYYLRIATVSITLALATLGLLIWGPEVVSLRLVATTPIGEEVAAGAPLRVTFSQAVDRQAAEASFQLVPPVAGRFFWEERTLTFQPERPLAPATTYEVRFGPELRDHTGRLVEAELGWSFRTRGPRLVALRTNPEGASQLWMVGVDGSGTRQLLNAPQGISELAVAPDGSAVAYVERRSTQRSALMLLNLETGAVSPLVDDESISLAAPAWSPGSDLLAFERRSLLEDRLGVPRIWLGQPDGTLLGPLMSGEDAPIAYGPVWSPDDSRIAFIDAERQELAVYSFFSDQVRQLPAYSVERPAWLADGTGLVFSGADGPSEEPRLSLVTLGEAPLRHSLTQDDQIALSPAVAPGGEAVAFTRREPESASGSIWLVASAGGPARQLSSSGAHLDHQVAWSPDGRMVVFVRSASTGTPRSEAVVLELASGDEQVVFGEVVQIVWAP